MCFGKAFPLILMHFISYIQCFEECFQKSSYFFLKRCFCQIFDWSKLFFDQSKFLLKFSMSFCLFRSIKNRKWAFLKIRSWPVQSIFLKKFSNFPLSLRLNKAPQQFFVISILNFCKVFLSISWYVHYTPPFSFIFSFTCIFSCIGGLFLDYA